MTFSVVPPLGLAAHIIGDDAEALAVARDLARDFAAGAAERDRDRRLPAQEIERFSASGLWGIGVPRAFGGAQASIATLTEVLAIISEADPSLGQIPQNHYCLVDAVRIVGTDEQKRRLFVEALAGKRFGNAVSELGGKTFREIGTRLSSTPQGLRLNGRKAYATGALFAHWVPVAAKDDEGSAVLVFLPRETAGLAVDDDWDGFGQRTTASGSVEIDHVAVEPWQVVARHRLFDPPSIHGALAQILHAAIDLGIARAALGDLKLWVQERTRAVPEATDPDPTQDPLTLAKIGGLIVRLHAAEALLQRAGHALDAASADPTPKRIADGAVATAEAKIASAELSLDASSTLIELAGTQSTRNSHNLDRHWRNARTHTVHDPIRWKYHTVGHYWLHDRLPKPHPALDPYAAKDAPPSR